MIIGLYAIIWAKAVDLDLEEIKLDIVVENKSIKCINLWIAQQNELVLWYENTIMSMYKQFYHD